MKKNSIDKPAICNNCGSDDLVGQAWVRLNGREVEDWVDGGLTHCDGCGGECVALYPPDPGYGPMERQRELALRKEERALEITMSWGVDGEYRVWDAGTYVDSFKTAEAALEALKAYREAELAELEARLKRFEESLIEESPGYGVGAVEAE